MKATGSLLALIVPAVPSQVVDLKARAVAQQARLALWLMRDARDGALLLQRLAPTGSGSDARPRDGVRVLR
jgi:hypothetical protein